MKRPSGASAPTSALLADGTPIDLEPLAAEICRRFYLRYPEELERSGESGTEWCRHDNQYLLAWAIQDARDDTLVLGEQSAWLANVLDSRGFPLERFSGNLRIAAEIIRERAAAGPLSERCAELLDQAAAACDERPAAG